MIQDDMLTIKAVLSYILKNSDTDKHDVYSIVKTAYYAQQNHMAEWGVPLFRDRIVALQFGPVPSLIYDILKISRGDLVRLEYYKTDNLKDIIQEVARSIKFHDESFCAEEEPDMNYLSESNVECLDYAIKKIASMNFDEIVRDTHGNEWKRARSKNNIMDDVKIASEGGASSAVLTYLKEDLFLDKCFSDACN